MKYKAISFEFINISQENLTEYQQLMLYYLAGSVAAEQNAPKKIRIQVLHSSDEHYFAKANKAIVVKFYQVPQHYITYFLLNFAFREDTNPGKDSEDSEGAYSSVYIHPRKIQRKPEVVQSLSFPNA